MSVRFSVTCQDAEGDAQTGLVVKLYDYTATVGVDAAVATLTDNSDGTYYCDVTATGKYKVTVGGVLQDELNGIYIVADDVVTDITGKMDVIASPTLNNLVAMDASGQSKDSGYAASNFLTSSHTNADGSGGSSSPATNKVHNAAAIAITDSAARITATDVENALAELAGSGRTTETIKSLATLIGTMVLSGSNYLSSYSNITSALLGIDTKLLDLTLRSAQAGQVAARSYLAFSYSGAISTLKYLNMAGGVICTDAQGYCMPVSGSITAITVSWSASAVDAGGSNSVLVAGYKNGAIGPHLTIVDGDETLLQKRATYALAEYPFAAGDMLQAYVLCSGTASVTNAVVLLEITLSA